MRAAGCLGFGALAFMTFIVSLVFWPLIVVAFGFLIAAIVMLCIPDRPQPPQVVVVQPVPMWWDGRRWRYLPLDLGVEDDHQNQNLGLHSLHPSLGVDALR